MKENYKIKGNYDECKYKKREKFNMFVSNSER